MLEYKENIILNNPADCIKVHHLYLKGSNYKIGKKLGQIAKDRHGIEKVTTKDALLTRCQRVYLEKNYPIFYERMKGIANAYDSQIHDDRIDFSILGEAILESSCSAVYYPPESTTTGHGIISRNLDLCVPTIVPAFSEPYIVEMYPDEGYSSISILSFKIMGESLEGINSEGLTVVHLADDESSLKHPMEPTYSNAVGLNELKTVQLILDTCANVEEAKEMLLLNKHFYMFQPIHLLIADRFGKSFVWEYSHAHNKEYIIDGKGKTQIITNFLLHSYGHFDELPMGNGEGYCPYNRYRVLDSAIKHHADKFSMDFVKKTNRLVYMEKCSFINPPEVPVRTLLHSIYDMEDRSLEVSFFLRELEYSDHEENESIRSPFFRFCLEH